MSAATSSARSWPRSRPARGASMRHAQALSVVLLLGLASTAAAQSEGAGGRGFPLELRKASLRVGEPAPDFVLEDVSGKSTVRLSKLKGKPVVLIFGSCT